MTKTHSDNKFLLYVVWLLEGILVGIGAILPGVSGGTLCVVFGMYRPLLETLSSLKTGLKKYGIMLAVFVLGIGVGFVGLSGIISGLLEANSVWVTCAFIGFIIGTLPELWSDAGTEGRTKGSFVSLVVSFVVMIGILTLFKTSASLTISPGIGGFLLCGLLWGLSFIVPGLSSSSLIMVFGLYEAMSKGISALDFKVLIPMAIGMGACVLLLSRAVEFAYKKKYSIVSHGVLGIVIATIVMIFPYSTELSALETAMPSLSEPVIRFINLLFIVGGALLSFGFSSICSKLKTKYKE